MLAHLSGIVAGVVALGAIGPLVVLLIWGPRSAFVRRHAVEALNFQITLLLATVVGGLGALLLTLVTLGLALLVLVPLALVLAVLALIWVVKGCIAGNQGQDYRYPVNLRLVS